MPAPQERSFVDTDVLVRLFDDGDPERQRIARGLVERLMRAQCGILSSQVLLELFSALTRQFKVSARTASLMASAFCEWPIVDADASLMQRAMARATHERLSIWDAAVVEAALRAGATTLYSEGMQHGRRFGPLTVLDPFA